MERPATLGAESGCFSAGINFASSFYPAEARRRGNHLHSENMKSFGHRPFPAVVKGETTHFKFQPHAPASASAYGGNYMREVTRGFFIAQVGSPGDFE
jgi:hypothetical protein